MRRLVLLACLVPLVAGCASSGTTTESLASEIVDDIPGWVQDEHLPPNAVPGARLFAVAGCTFCHTYDGAGRSTLNAPDLTAIGTHNLGIAVEIQHLEDPASVIPGSPMPKFASLGRKRLDG